MLGIRTGYVFSILKWSKVDVVKGTRDGHEVTGFGDLLTPSNR